MADISLSEQDRRSKKKPIPPLQGTVDFFFKNWGICLDPTKCKQIESYDDANFYCKSEEGADGVKTYLIKFYNATETECPDVLYGLGCMLDRINQQLTASIEVPSIIPPLVHENSLAPADNFVYFDGCEVADGTRCRIAVRVFHWISGTTLSRQTPTLNTMVQLGAAIGAVTTALAGFDHPSFHRAHLWDLTQLDLSYGLLSYVDDDAVQGHIRAIHGEFHSVVLPVAHELPRSVIMADCNDANVIVTEPGPSNPSASRAGSSTGCDVVGLIDFSDAVHTWRINEIAIAMAYALLTSYGKAHPYKALAALLAGYISLTHAALAPLSQAELDCLPVLVKVRLSISVMVGACAIFKEPHNEYLKLHAVPGRAAICFLSAQADANTLHRALFAEVQQQVLAARTESATTATTATTATGTGGTTYSAAGAGSGSGSEDVSAQERVSTSTFTFTSSWMSASMVPPRLLNDALYDAVIEKVYGSTGGSASL
jgi:Ser/Thr protein kinase RdoA (MazF antagonist)